MSVRVYVEGGGPSKGANTAAKCRQGFHQFLEKLIPGTAKPRIIACGGRKEAFDDFVTQLDRGNDDFVMLLVDAEAASADPEKPWKHLSMRDGWTKPANATNEQAHLMTQCMESWFMADKSALESFYGQDFVRGSLPGNPEIEMIPKQDILNGLVEATRRSKSKGAYNKGLHSFEILGLIDAQRVRDKSTHVDRLRNTLLKYLDT